MERFARRPVLGYACLLGFGLCGWWGNPAYARAGGGVLMYSNTGANLPLNIGIDRLIADDIFLDGQCDCDLNRFEFTVTGGGNGSGPGFTVDYAIYLGCPDTGGTIIPGTEGSATLPDDGTHVVVVNHTGDPLLISPVFWLGIQSSDTGVKWLAGEAPEFGFSANRYHAPGFACQTVFGGTTAPYASFAARVFCNPLTDPPVLTPIPDNGETGVDTLTTVLTWNGTATAGTAGALPADEQVKLVTPATFVDATVHPDEFLRTWKAAIANGEVPDPANKVLPKVAPRTEFGGGGGVAGAIVPEVTANDIFVYEDSNDVLATTSFSQGTLFNLMTDATNAVTTQFGDNFDFVGFFLNFVPHHQIGAAFYLGIENDVSGIGLGQFSSRQNFGIAGDNVEGWVMMWNQANWQTGYFTFTQLVLGQEFEHRFGMFLSPLPGGRPLQGNNGGCGRSSHWNFRVDGQASGMEIREWVGSSPALRMGGTLDFNADIQDGVFSYPDLYIMGYVSPAEMDAGASELRYMDDNCATPYNGPVSTWGSADIEATNGIRTPGSVLAQKHFRTAWVMLHRPGQQNLPSPTQIAHTVSMLNTWNDVYITSTLGRGTMSNVLMPVDQPAPCDTLYDVRFGQANPPASLICESVIEPMCDPGALNPDTQYFWQVTATRTVDVTAGPVWSFDTFCNVAASDPPNCAIDARQPHPIEDSNAAQGWDSVALTFQCPTASALPEDFMVSVESGAPPIISDVVLSGNTATIQLSQPIPPGQWTCITHVASGSQTCLAALPADVNGDRTSAPSDVLAVIDSLNGVIPRPDYATDADRSGVSGPADILSVIDLLNGAGQFSPWINATIGVCPSAP